MAKSDNKHTSKQLTKNLEVQYIGEVRQRTYLASERTCTLFGDVRNPAAAMLVRVKLTICQEIK